MTGNRFSEGGIPLAISANLIWRDGRRGFMECAFDRAPVQYLEVRLPTCACSLVYRETVRSCSVRDATQGSYSAGKPVANAEQYGYIRSGMCKHWIWSK